MFLIAAFYAGCDEILVGILFSISISGYGLNAAGLDMNVLDLGPNYQGFLSSLVLTVTSGAAILAPYTIGVLITNVNSFHLHSFRIVLFGINM